MNQRRIHRLTVWLFVLAGFCAGFSLPGLLHMGTGDYTGFFSLYSFQKYEGSEIHPAKLFYYVAGLRLRTLLFLWMSAFTVAGLLFHLAYAMWLSVSAGMLLSLFLLRDGYEGIWLLACCLLPQWFFYGAVWRRETGFLLYQNGSMAFVQGTGISVIRKRELGQLGVMVLLCLAGCLCEAFLGSWTLKIFLQLFT